MLAWRGSRNCVVKCGTLMPIKINTTITVGAASATARLPLCLGPNQLIQPMNTSTATVVIAMWSFANLIQKICSPPEVR